MNAKKKLDIEQATRELEESVYFQPTSPQIEKYTTHLTPATIKAVKWYALEHDLKDYEVVQQALDVFLAAKHE